MAQLFSLGDVARMLSLPQHRISYAITNQLVAEPTLRIGGKRIFNESDLSHLASYFGVAVVAVERSDQKGCE